MKRIMRAMGAAVFAAALPLFAWSAFAAEGLAAQPGQIPAAGRASLAREIDAYRKAHPEAFRAVLELKGIRPEVYMKFRNPLPNAAPELRAMGASGLLPMLSVIAFEGFPAPLSEKERTALTAGMLEAVGLLRDPRSGPVLKAALEGGSKDPVVVRAAAEAMGRLCGDAELATLIKHTAARDDLREASIRGLGQCKRVESAKHLAALLATAPDGASAELTAGALGIAGSSWAWKAMGPSAEATGLAVREIAARALVEAFPRHTGDARARIGKSMLLVEHPLLPELLRRARASAKADVQIALEGLEKQLERQLAR